jgi:hypothetical protein
MVMELPVLVKLHSPETAHENAIVSALNTEMVTCVPANDVGATPKSTVAYLGFVKNVVSNELLPGEYTKLAPYVPVPSELLSHPSPNAAYVGVPLDCKNVKFC